MFDDVNEPRNSSYVLYPNRVMLGTMYFKALGGISSMQDMVYKMIRRKTFNNAKVAGNFKNYFDMETGEAGSFDLYWKIKITAKKAMNLSDKGNHYINLLECHGTEVTHIIIYVKGDNNDLKTIKLNAGLGIKDNKIYLKFATNVEGATWYVKLNDKKWK